MRQTLLYGQFSVSLLYDDPQGFTQ